MTEKIPAEIVEARTFTKKTMLGITLASCAIVPFALLSKTLADPQSFMNIAMAVWGTCLGVGALVFPWRKLSAAQSLVKEYDRMRAKEALVGLVDTESAVDDSHPLAPIVKRVRELAGGDQRMLDIVDTLVSRLHTLASDLDSLKSAVAIEHGLGAQSSDPRMERLNAVVAEKEEAESALQNALRDLHVELTMRADQDHSPLLTRLDDLLLDLTVEGEIAGDVGGQSVKQDRLSVLQQSVTSQQSSVEKTEESQVS